MAGRAAAPDLSDLAAAIRANPAQHRALVDQGPVDDAFAGAATVLRRSYVWPYQMHASIGPSCAVADFSEGRLKLWAGTQNPHMLRTDLDRLLQLGEERIEIVRLEAAGCYGRNCADDVCADAALLSMAVGAPVRVQLTREQEHQWEPKGTAQLMDVSAAIDARGELLAYDFAVRYPPTTRRCWPCCSRAASRASRARWRWATARPCRPTATPASASPAMTWRPSCVRPGCAASRPCPTPLPTTA
jgi:isoquinoline 1-oxidoreductase